MTWDTVVWNNINIVDSIQLSMTVKYSNEKVRPCLSCVSFVLIDREICCEFFCWTRRDEKKYGDEESRLDIRSSRINSWAMNETLSLLLHILIHHQWQKRCSLPRRLRFSWLKSRLRTICQKRFILHFLSFHQFHLSNDQRQVNPFPAVDLFLVDFLSEYWW